MAGLTAKYRIDLPCGEVEGPFLARELRERVSELLGDNWYWEATGAGTIEARDRETGAVQLVAIIDHSLRKE